IVRLVREPVEEAIPNVGTRLFVRDEEGALRDVGGDALLPSALALALVADGGCDAPDTDVAPPVLEALAGVGAEIAVPMQVGSGLVGVLTAGAKRSGLRWSAGDREFLRALAHQAAIALQNAASYEALVAVNAHLEERVRVRSAELEGANR